jgi:hypothetical protein
MAFSNVIIKIEVCHYYYYRYRYKSIETVNLIKNSFLNYFLHLTSID